MQDDPGIQFITRENGLEVDGRGIQHHPYDSNAPLENTEAHFQANFRPDVVSTPYDHGQDTVSPKEISQRRWRRIIVTRRLLWLSLALAMMSCFAVTAAVLAVFFAKKSGRRYVLGEPTSNCKELKSPYNSINGSSFNLYCGTDYLYNDLMSVWVYQFVDCIHACVSFNANHRILNDSSESCTGVSYPYTSGYGRSGAFDWDDGNCFLKAVYPLPNTIPGDCDSAFYTDLEPT